MRVDDVHFRVFVVSAGVTERIRISVQSSIKFISTNRACRCELMSVTGGGKSGKAVLLILLSHVDTIYVFILFLNNLLV